jgi:TRAP-type C4-dicarboxylate transport system permease small subunit
VKAVFKKIDRVIFQVFKILSYVSAVSLVAVAVLCTANVITTKLFKFGILNATELVTYLNIPVVFMAIAYIQVERGHTSIDLLLDKFPHIVQQIIMFLSYVLGTVVCGFIGWREITLTIDKFTTSARASSSRTSFLVWPFAAVVAIGFLTLAIAMLWCAIREFVIPKEERVGYVPPASAGFDGEPDADKPDREEDRP